MATLVDFRSIPVGTDSPTRVTNIIIGKPSRATRSSHPTPRTTTPRTTATTEVTSEVTPTTRLVPTRIIPTVPTSSKTTTSTTTTTATTRKSTTTTTATTSRATSVETTSLSTSQTTTTPSTTSSKPTPDTTSLKTTTQDITTFSSTTPDNITRGGLYDSTPLEPTSSANTTLFIILGVFSVAIVILVALSIYFGIYRKKKEMKRSASNNNILLDTPTMRSHTSTIDLSAVEQVMPDITSPDDYEHITDYEEYQEPCPIGVYAEIGEPPANYEPMVASGMDGHVYAKTDTEQYEEPLSREQCDTISEVSTPEADPEYPHYDKLDLDSLSSVYHSGEPDYELASELDDNENPDYQLADEDEMESTNNIVRHNIIYNVVDENI